MGGETLVMSAPPGLIDGSKVKIAGSESGAPANAEGDAKKDGEAMR